MKIPLEEYLARFPNEKVDTCFAYGPSSRYGREGTYYCANCNKSVRDIYEYDQDIPMKNEEDGHCWVCLEENVNDN